MLSIWILLTLTRINLLQLKNYQPNFVLVSIKPKQKAKQKLNPIRYGQHFHDLWSTLCRSLSTWEVGYILPYWNKIPCILLKKRIAPNYALHYFTQNSSGYYYHISHFSLSHMRTRATKIEFRYDLTEQIESRKINRRYWFNRLHIIDILLKWICGCLTLAMKRYLKPISFSLLLP